MMFWVKVIRTPGAVLVNACDDSLLGKEFLEGEVVLRVTESFYGGRKVSEGELKDLLEDADIVSLVGEGAIAVAVEMGLATWRHVKRVQGTPHLNIYRL